MFFAQDPTTVSHGIQLAVAPVLLLTAAATMIGTVAGRLARIVDRSRVVDERIDKHPNDMLLVKNCLFELRRLQWRGRLVNACIALLTFGAIFIGITIVALFVGETTDLNLWLVSTLAFLSGVGCFVLALLCFLTETMLSTHLLRFKKIDDSIARQGVKSKFISSH